MSSTIEVVATILFVLAIIHTFSVPVFAKLAHKGGPHAGIWHLMSEVEAVFGIWAAVLLVFMAITSGVGSAVSYMDSRNFTEPLFVCVIMVIAGSRPILEMVKSVVRTIAQKVPVHTEVATFFITLSLVPLLGSFITEPAAMTLAALMLREAFFSRTRSLRLKYLVIGVLFVNISIGGVLTSYAAPPVLMVAQTFGWDSAYMSTHFGWRSVIAVFINASLATFVCYRDIIDNASKRKVYTTAEQERPPVPFIFMLIHSLFLLGVVVFAHHVAVFIGLLMLFIGFCSAYSKHQDPLMIKEGLMVGFFLAGLIILGGLQKWWLQDILAGLSPMALYWGTTILTAVTDNAALTYLGSLVDGTSDMWRYMLVAGAVTGGGLTVIANAPNPAGFSILRTSFPEEAISPKSLILGALIPTLIAAVLFLIPV
ncbi:hypothetical protein F9B74_04350 [Pelistega sp. NLN82]|uniref:Na+/H+ antiporter n=1 Tax=Pelistega ratti TaxID=2652177 RepID=A0A6L9Y5A8_9BURK|nr:putative Na+/H+ antiporter [Pelistega ratti]NEN75559.1 hypothetical protein [Pelistega ratti]